ncbi:MAG: hypothetical protein IPM48_14740 [Saprospiraceae bacterium]|nr:hypothetical protein [Saprospiraceae bacterium]
MDLTDIAGTTIQAQKGRSGSLPKRAQFVPAEKYDNQNEEEANGVPNNPQAKAFRKTHWTPDKFVQDGQISAGDVDKDQEEFLKED